MKINYIPEYSYLYDIPTHEVIWFESCEVTSNSTSIAVYAKNMGDIVLKDIKHKVEVYYEEDSNISAHGYIWQDGEWALFHTYSGFINTEWWTEDEVVKGMYKLLTYV